MPEKFNSGVSKIIKSEGLHYEYARFDETLPAQVALSNIDFEVAAGEFIAVLGANGSGKSTLAKHINALLAPTSGSLHVHGLDTKDEANTWSIRQQTGMVFQNPDNQLIATIVEEDVAFGPENLGLPPAEILARVEESLQNVSMQDYALAQPHQLSGGQKQRVAIAGVLAMRPSTIILDEPTAMLDPIGRREVMDTICRLNREYGITIILITHFMEEAARASRIIVMDSGKIVLDAPPREVFRQSGLLARLGLTIPAATALANILRGRGLDFPGDILNREEFCDAYFNLTVPRPPGTPKAASPTSEKFVCSVGDAPLGVPQNHVKLEISDLRHTYSAGTPFEKHALDNISFDIKKGEFVAVIGATGSGKSTLVQHFNALLKPSAGSVMLDGTDIFADKTKLKSVRQRVGLIFQYPEHQLFEMSVYKDIAFGPANMGLSEEKIAARVREALALVGLGEEFLDKSPFELSGGQKRRVAIAGVLAMKPEILILDEPTAGLDPAGRKEILAEVSAMHAQLGITVVMVSHNMEEVAALAQRIIVMHNGKIAQQGRPAEIFAEPEKIRAVGLDAPEITSLMAMLKQRGLALPAGIFTAEEAADVLCA